MRVRLRIWCPDRYAEERAELVSPIMLGVHRHGAVLAPLILSDRLDRGAMGGDRALGAATRWPGCPDASQLAGGRERPALHRPHGLCLASAAPGVPQPQHRALLLRQVDLGWDLRPDRHRAGHARARSSGPGSRAELADCG